MPDTFPLPSAASLKVVFSVLENDTEECGYFSVLRAISLAIQSQLPED